MKCRTCGLKAVVNMRQHKLALCKEHYLEWLPMQVDRFVKKYNMFTRSERILVAVSGGKDSLALWDILADLDYQVDGLYINLGIGSAGGYSNISMEKVIEFSSGRNLKTHLISLEKEYGKTIPSINKQTDRGKKKPCSICGLVKRYLINCFAIENDFQVLATGHNLDDETATLFGNTLHWDVEYLQRQSPVLAGVEGFIRKVKPLCRFYEKDMAAYAILKRIDYIYEECPYSAGSRSIYYKQQLNILEHKNPGEKLRFYVHFLKAKDKGLFSPVIEHQDKLQPCANCGQPTSIPGICSFCRIINQISVSTSSISN